MSGLPTPAGPPRRRHAGAIGVAVGALTMMAGTFAPWLASGRSERNLYSSAGLVQRLVGLGRPVGLALDALPLTGIYCLAAGTAYLVGRRRIAAGAITLLAVVFAALAVAALSHRRAGEVHLLSAGPTVTLVGALICLVTLLAYARPHQYRTPDPTPDPSTAPTQGRPRTMEFR